METTFLLGWPIVRDYISFRESNTPYIYIWYPPKKKNYLFAFFTGIYKVFGIFGDLFLGIFLFFEVVLNK